MKEWDRRAEDEREQKIRWSSKQAIRTEEERKEGSKRLRNAEENDRYCKLTKECEEGIAHRVDSVNNVNRAGKNEDTGIRRVHVRLAEEGQAERSTRTPRRYTRSTYSCKCLQVKSHDDGYGVFSQMYYDVQCK